MASITTVRKIAGELFTVERGSYRGLVVVSGPLSANAEAVRMLIDELRSRGFDAECSGVTFGKDRQRFIYVRDAVTL